MLQKSHHELVGHFQGRRLPWFFYAKDDSFCSSYKCILKFFKTTWGLGCSSIAVTGAWRTVTQHVSSNMLTSTENRCIPKKLEFIQTKRMHKEQRRPLFHSQRSETERNGIIFLQFFRIHHQNSKKSPGMYIMKSRSMVIYENLEMEVYP